jgi:hypothetical protein
MQNWRADESVQAFRDVHCLRVTAYGYRLRMSTPEIGRQAAHVLIDAVSVYDREATEASNTQAVVMALSRLHDIGVIEVTSGVDGVQVEASNLVMPAVTAMTWLLSQLAEATGEDKETLIAELRDLFDQ